MLLKQVTLFPTDFFHVHINAHLVDWLNGPLSWCVSLLSVHRFCSCILHPFIINWGEQAPLRIYIHKKQRKLNYKAIFGWEKSGKTDNKYINMHAYVNKLYMRYLCGRKELCGQAHVLVQYTNKITMAGNIFGTSFYLDCKVKTILPIIQMFRVRLYGRDSTVGQHIGMADPYYIVDFIKICIYIIICI